MLVVLQVAINTTITDVNEFLNHIVTSTNMKCLTPPSALSGSCGFLAANLYAKSVFGEDALVNLSVEKGADGKLSGYIRIRWGPASTVGISQGVLRHCDCAADVGAARRLFDIVLGESLRWHAAILQVMIA